MFRKVSILSKYLFKWNTDLFDINTMEMDEGLVGFFEDIEISDGQFECVNEKNITRKLKINWQDKTIQGRGLKGFFKPYQSNYLFIEKSDDNKIKVSSLSSPITNEVKSIIRNPESVERTENVLKAMSDMKQSSEIWFQLYDLAQIFQFDNNRDNLICLPHLREINTYDYQVKTVKSVINRLKGRALLCDEVGLGKTIEAGMTMLEYIMRGLARKILIICPPSLVQQWENEMKRKFNQDFIRSDDPAFKKMGEEAWGHFPKVIASIAMAKRKEHREIICAQHYDLVIVDEAHHLKNRNTQAWKFVNDINKKYILLLTATPVQNHLEELYNLITLLKPGQLNTYRSFKKNYIDSKDGIEAKNVDKLKTLLSDVMIRNKRSNVDVAFTKRFAFTKTVELTNDELHLYQEISTFIRQKYKEEGSILTRFQLKALQEQMGSTYFSLATSLEKLADNDRLSKIDRDRLLIFASQALEITEKEINGNKKVEQLVSILSNFKSKMIVFTKFKSTQIYLVEILKKQGFKVAEFHGGLRRKEKEQQVAYFRDEADVLVSTEVGGEGRNLQFCHGMINYDLPWNPMAIEQRIGRIHRIGQTNDVYVYNLVAKKTIEHFILNLLDRKINMFELVVGEVDMILGDIEDTADFSDLVMDAWARSENETDIEKELDKIGNELLKNKQKLMKQKVLDEKIF